MAGTRRPPIRRDWLSKSIAGTLLGFTLALACSGLFVRLVPDMPLTTKSQLAMWMVPPVWFAVLGGVFLFGNGWRAWLWLGLANLLAAGALLAPRLS